MATEISDKPGFLSRFGMLFGVALLCLWFASKIKGGYEAYLLLDSKSTVDAVCTYQTYGREGGTKYSFTINGQTYYGEAPKSYLEEGSTLKVVFLESNPSINLPSDRVLFDVWAGGLLAVFVVASVSLIGFFQIRRLVSPSNIVEVASNPDAPSSLAA